MKALIPILLLGLIAASGRLQFQRENIAVEVFAPDTVQVTGTYFFASSSGRGLRSRVMYPFPGDSLSFPPDTVVVVDNEGETIGYRESPLGVTFPVTVPDTGVCSVTVVYRQRVRENTGRYILTTTQAWDRPLGPSNYSVSLPDSLALSHLSYTCDTVVRNSGKRIYQFYRDKFMPQRDIIFTWE